MKKIITVIVILVLTPFIVRPSNVTELYAPFHDEQHLLITVIMPKPDDLEFLELVWPTWFTRFLASQHEFDFVSNYENNQSTLQLILAALFYHEENDSDKPAVEYVMTIAQLSLDKGSAIDNVAGYGLAALHEAVLFNSISATKFLVNNRADCNVLISRPGKPIDGMTALEMAEFLKVQKDKDRTEIIAYLKSHGCNKSKP